MLQVVEVVAQLAHDRVGEVLAGLGVLGLIRGVFPLQAEVGGQACHRLSGMSQPQGADAGLHERDVANDLAACPGADPAGLGQEREPVAEGDDVPAVQIWRVDPAVLALQP
ncbi:hypothetical protein [Streptomyces sp. NPDC048349]|uniref:hypothetical protein n=1 Tax=Streptomyces sp. NPDC048349 TaxID=3155486 RepID=UPI003426FF74